MKLRLTPPTPTPCDDCGSSPVFHRLEWLSSAINDFFATIAALFGTIRLDKIARVVERALSPIAPPLFLLLSKIGLGEITHVPDDKDFKFVTHVLWEEANTRSIKLWQFRPFGLPKEMFVAEYETRSLMFERAPVPRHLGRGVPWMDDKAILKRKLIARGFPTPKGRACVTLGEALRTFAELEKPVIVKPSRGSGTRHTTLHITDIEGLRKAFQSAKRLSLQVVVEEELEGHVYRPTLVGGKLVATIRRDPPEVIGDGNKTILELIREENSHPKRQGPVFSPIVISETVIAELKRQGKTLESILDKGERIPLHQKINWSIGGTTEDVTDVVHPDNKKLFEDVAALTEAPLIGIDFIIRDISRSWKEEKRSGIIETNSMPFFDNHHLPFKGEPQNVAAHLWELTFPGSGLNR